MTRQPGLASDTSDDNSHNAGEPTTTVIVTIISKNYLAAARTLMQSVRQLHDDVVLMVGLVDTIDDRFSPADEVFDVVLASDLGIPRWEHFAMKYNITELNTAIKPFLLEYLFEHLHAARLIYFDPDIVVYQRLDELLALLDDYTFILTPHLLAPYEDDRHPGEYDILRAGTYNLGFIAISRQGAWRQMLHWWQTHLYSKCFADTDAGLFTDQRWIDLLPGLFEGVYVLRNPAHNVAYWNFTARSLRVDNDGVYSVDEVPLVFFHFSGYSIERPDIVSKHQNRFTFSDLNDAYNQIFEEYRQLLLDNGALEVAGWPYAYGTFADGVKITAALRRCLREYDLEGYIWPNPFDIQQEYNFRDWARFAMSEDIHISPLGLTLYRMLPYIRRLFPDILSEDGQLQFLGWFAGQHKEGVIDPYFVEPARTYLDEASQHRAMPPSPVSIGPPRALLPPPQPERTLPEKIQYYAIHPGNFWRVVFYKFYRLYAPEPSRRKPNAEVAVEPVTVDIIHDLENPLVPNDVPELDIDPDTLPDETPAASGVNIIGYLQSEMGIGEVAREIAHALDTVQFPINLHSVDEHSPARIEDRSAAVYETGTRYSVNLFCVNADMTFPTRDLVGLTTYTRRYNIGYWFWETARFPEEWLPALDVYDEVWVGSRFVQEAVAKQATVPVVRVPVPLQVTVDETVARSDFGLHDDQFVVLYVFDANSVIERKNPYGVIEAFKRAFLPHEQRRRVRLVMKVNNLAKYPEHNHEIMSLMDEINGVLITDYLDRPVLNALIGLCDVYVSLHRSEGYGLTMKEAMVLGKPVIATAYSGNMDFMHPDNSYLVPYELK
ncbi:MAG: glycosyltransferase, partial [Chloroflexota bacterium]